MKGITFNIIFIKFGANLCIQINTNLSKRTINYCFVFLIHQTKLINNIVTAFQNTAFYLKDFTVFD